jgi:uncharacterized protein (TIRG00374 family)
MKKNVLIGLFVSGICCYFAVRGINFSEVKQSFQSANFLYIIPVVLVVLVGHYIRSYRWGIIIESLVKYDQLTLFKIATIGYMTIGILPARLGEFARPYLVKQQSGIKMSSTMATVIVERVFDVLAIIVVLFAVVVKISLPPIIFKTGIVTLAVAFSVFIILIFLAVKKEFSLNKIETVFCRLPDRFEKPLKHLTYSFIEGLQILPDIKKTLYVFLLSIVMWSLVSLSAYLLFFAFDFNLPVINAFAITVIIALGVMLPAAPGFVGTYHVACVLGLTSFGISKPDALSYAIVLHFLQLITVVGLGLIFLPFIKISFVKFIRNEEEEIKKEGLTD